MSVGLIWYRTQPDPDITRAVGELLADYCGPVISHDVTARSERLATLMGSVFSRCDNIVIIGGLDISNRDENTVFMLSRILGIPMEEKYLSRSKYRYDKLRDIRLPSLSGSILFPDRYGGPEGILLTSGAQSVIVLPSEVKSAVACAVSMRETLAPEASRRRSRPDVPTPSGPEQKDFEKFTRSGRTASATREYSEEQLLKAMERAADRAAREAGDYNVYDYIYDDQNRGSR